MIPLELWSMIGGAASGFIFKYIAIQAQNRQEQFKMMMDKFKSEEDSRKEAFQRVPEEAGKWIRRVIIVCILFGVILAPFIMSLIGIPIIIEVDANQREYLFGLVGGGVKKVFYEVNGYLLISEFRSALIGIISAYFGAAFAKAN